MNVVFVEQLDQQLRDIEASAREYDTGNKDAAIRIARCLRQIFDHTAKSTSLLAQLQARFTRLSSSVDEAPLPPRTVFAAGRDRGEVYFPRDPYKQLLEPAHRRPADLSTDAGEKETDQASSRPPIGGGTSR